ncbi:uncharacterized protein [Antedon mediterranea]|uniref:uncharacterized protein n=1 Tax=Antedon mediterranea TaxID=105859 RepID=UPI003AF4CDF3
MLLLSGDVEPNPGPTNSFDQSEHHLNVYYQIIRSLKNKVTCYKTELVSHLLANKFQIVGLCETWLNDTILDAELAVPGFHLHRRDRDDGRRGGGVLLLVSDDFQSKRLDIVNCHNLEAIFVEIQASRRKKLIVGVIYRPPDKDSRYTELMIVEQLMT